MTDRVYHARVCPKCKRSAFETLLLDSYVTGMFCLHCLAKRMETEQKRVKEELEREKQLAIAFEVDECL